MGKGGGERSVGVGDMMGVMGLRMGRGRPGAGTWLKALDEDDADMDVAGDVGKELGDKVVGGIGGVAGQNASTVEGPLPSMPGT